MINAMKTLLPYLKDDHYGVVNHLLHKLRFVWGDFDSVLVPHVLEINLIEATFNYKYLNVFYELSNAISNLSVLLKELMTTSGKS